MSTQRARQLRQRMTDAEKRLWVALRSRRFQGFKFRRQEPIGRFIVDFVCFEKKLVVEVDGGQHLSEENYDAARTAWLQGEGFEVLRYWNNDVVKNIQSVLADIQNHLED